MATLKGPRPPSHSPGRQDTSPAPPLRREGGQYVAAAAACETNADRSDTSEHEYRRTDPRDHRRKDQVVCPAPILTPSWHARSPAARQFHTAQPPSVARAHGTACVHARRTLATALSRAAVRRIWRQDSPFGASIRALGHSPTRVR